MSKIEIVKFNNGKFGIRKKCWYGGYYFLSWTYNWYHPFFNRDFVYSHCMFCYKEQAESILKMYNDKLNLGNGEPV